MARTLSVIRKKQMINGPYRWEIRLDNCVLGILKKADDSISIQIDEQMHQLKVTEVSIWGKPTIGIDPVTEIIMAGKHDCTVSVSMAVGMVKNKIKLECTYDAAPISESNFIDAVTELMVNVFNGNAILERLEDPNNRRHDLGVSCHNDGVHIRWELNETKNMDEWSKGYAEETIPYEAAGVTMPKDQLTSDLLNRLEASVKNGILTRTRFVKNKYGAFVPGNKKSSLY